MRTLSTEAPSSIPINHSLSPSSTHPSPVPARSLSHPDLLLTSHLSPPSSVKRRLALRQVTPEYAERAAVQQHLHRALGRWLLAAGCSAASICTHYITVQDRTGHDSLAVRRYSKGRGTYLHTYTVSYRTSYTYPLAVHTVPWFVRAQPPATKPSRPLR